jgi:hypothetical protein
LPERNLTALGDDRRHEFIGVVHALAAQVWKRIGERGGEVRRVGGRELIGAGYRGTIADRHERGESLRGVIVLVAILLALPARADPPDISARRLLSAWKGDEPSMHIAPRSSRAPLQAASIGPLLSAERKSIAYRRARMGLGLSRVNFVSFRMRGGL